MSNSLELFDSRSNTTGQRGPKYQHVYDYFCAEIRAGRFSPGQAMPTEAKLSAVLGVSRSTIRQALGKLEDDGMVERVQGRGTFLTSEQQRVSRKRRAAFALLAPEIREGVYPSLIYGFEEGCAGIQHQMVICNSSNDIGRQADLLIQLLDQEIAGLAVVPSTSPTPPHQLCYLQKSFIPVVCCHRTVSGVRTPSVVFSGFENGEKAAQAFLERGHRRITFFFQRRYSMVDEREAGMRAAMNAHPQAARCELELIEYGKAELQHDKYRRKFLSETLKHLLTKPDHPTAIFCSDLDEAEQTYLQATDMGLDIPGDLSLVCFGSSFRQGELAQRISSVCTDERELGACAAQLLHEMSTGKRAIDNGEQIVFPMSLFVGETLGEV